MFDKNFDLQWIPFKFSLNGLCVFEKANCLSFVRKGKSFFLQISIIFLP